MVALRGISAFPSTHTHAKWPFGEREEQVCDTANQKGKKKKLVFLLAREKGIYSGLTKIDGRVQGEVCMTGNKDSIIVRETRQSTNSKFTDR
jgi:hypothetical protein